MVSTKQLTMIMNGITAAHVAEHGSESLLPQRKDPIGPDLARKLLSTRAGTILGSKVLDWSSTLFLNLGAMFALGVSTGFRKAEVALPNGAEFDDRRLRRGSVLWEIDGTVHADPPPNSYAASPGAATKPSSNPLGRKPTNPEPSGALTQSGSRSTTPTSPTPRGGCSALSSPPQSTVPSVPACRSSSPRPQVSRP